MSDTLAATGSFTVPADHPCLVGHFPGDPIVPAALLLDLIFATVQEAQPKLGELRGVKSAKFVHPVRPDEEVGVFFSVSGDRTTARFTCKTQAGQVASGEILLAPPR